MNLYRAWSDLRAGRIDQEKTENHLVYFSQLLQYRHRFIVPQPILEHRLSKDDYDLRSFYKFSEGFAESLLSLRDVQWVKEVRSGDRSIDDRFKKGLLVGIRTVNSAKWHFHLLPVFEAIGAVDFEHIRRKSWEEVFNVKQTFRTYIHDHSFAAYDHHDYNKNFRQCSYYYIYGLSTDGRLHPFKEEMVQNMNYYLFFVTPEPIPHRFMIDTIFAKETRKIWTR